MDMESWSPGMKCEICKLISCKCVRCKQCKKNVPPRLICARCHVCREHHTVYAPKDFPSRGCTYWSEYEGTTYEINPLRRHLGLELEMGNFGSMSENRPKFKFANYSLVHDGSVQGSGLELVTEKLVGDNYIYGVSEITRALQAAKATVNKSCGFHVHVDAGDFGPFDLRRILVGFTLIQDGLYGSLVDKTRLGEWGKTYCAPLVVDIPKVMNIETKSGIVDFFHEWLYETIIPQREHGRFESYTDEQWRAVLRDIDAQLKRFKSTKYMNHARRWALNFHSWMMRGTMEFRLKEGTADPADIIMWPLWCGWFVDCMSKTDDKEILYWVKTPPTIIEMSRHMEAVGMPSYVLDWVKSKVAA